MEIFTNTLADAEVVQKLLEEHSHTLAKAYEIAHCYVTTRRAARTVMQLMQLSLRSTAEWRSRATTVRENANTPAGGEPVGVVTGPTGPPEGAPKSYQQSWPKNNKNAKMNWTEVTCHNCSCEGHLQKSCPSPHRPKPPAPSLHGMSPAPNPGTVVTCNPSQKRTCFSKYWYSAVRHGQNFISRYS